MTELPPLPQPMLKVYERPHGLVELRYFTAEDMRAYAEAAIKHEREAPEVEAMRMLWDDQQHEEKEHYLGVVRRARSEEGNQK